jgi:hypothetical protein
MSNDRDQFTNYHQGPSSGSALSFDFPLKSNKKFLISDSFNISLEGKLEAQSDSNVKINGCEMQNDNQDMSKDITMRNKVNIKQKPSF